MNAPQPAPMLALPSSSAIASILKPSMTRRAARTALHDAGWEYIGGGSFASTWASPDGYRVAKVTKPDGGQRALIAAAQKHPDNPHLPTIYAFLQLKRGGFVVEMERLDFEGDYYEVSGYEDNAPIKSEVSPELYEAWHSIEAERKDARLRRVYLDWDLHYENVMFRDGVPVFLDPLYEPRRHRNASGRGGSYHAGSDGLLKRAQSY